MELKLNDVQNKTLTSNHKVTDPVKQEHVGVNDNDLLVIILPS